MRKYTFALMAAFSLLSTLQAADFKIEDGETVVTPQILTDEGDEGEIEEGGTLATSSTAVTMQNDNQTLDNEGLISTTGVSSHGIFSSGADARIKNSGEISTTGGSAHGIFSSGADARIKNSGEISTMGGGANGIRSSGADARIKNSGEISTTGQASAGIFSSGADARIKNSGEISTTGLLARGIISSVVDARIKNSGEISTTGGSAQGILSSGADARIKNSGEIATTGGFAQGINSSGADAWIKNSGEISTTGAGADGIRSFGANGHVINSGTIKSENAFAINFIGMNPTLTLKRGSNLQGGINVDDSLNLNVSKGLNLDLTITNGVFDNLDIEDPYVLDDRRVVTVDRTGFAMQVDFLADLSDAILGGISHNGPASPCCLNPCARGFWVSGLGSYRHRGSRGDTVDYRNKQAGVLFGFDTALCEGNAGIFGAVMRGKTDISRNTQDADTKSYVGGLTYSQDFCGNCLGFALAGGYVEWENKRDVMNNLAGDGKETAKACLDAAFVTAEASLSRRVCFLPCDPVMSFMVRYATLLFEDYKEKGASAKLSVKNRDIDLLTTRLEVSFMDSAFKIYCICFEPYVGVYGRYQLRGNRVDAKLLDETLSFDQGGKRNIAAVLSGFRGTRTWGANTFFLNLELDYDTAKSVRYTGEVGFSF